MILLFTLLRFLFIHVDRLFHDAWHCEVLLSNDFGYIDFLRRADAHARKKGIYALGGGKECLMIKAKREMMKYTLPPF